MTNEQWEAIYNAAYAASDAWKKEREDLIASRNQAVLECRNINKERDSLAGACKYWKDSFEEQLERVRVLEQDIDELTAANQKLANQRDQDVGALGDATEERDEWKAAAENQLGKVKALEQELDELVIANNALIKERDGAQSERDEAVKERACTAIELRDTISGYNGLTILYDKLLKQHEELKASHETYKKSREYWNNLYDQERAHNYNLESENHNLKRALESQAQETAPDIYTRLDSLERIVGVHEVNIYNLDTRVDKLEETK